MPKVSVIIPAYNAAGSINRSLESVLSQDYGDVEIIIVNDGSTDDTESVLRKYLSDNKIKYFKTENKGVSRAINTGLKEATGDYLCFLHADDLFLPGKIKTQVLLMEKYKNYGISYTKESYFREGNVSRVIKSPYFHFSGDIFYFLKRSNFIHMSTVMLRKNTLGKELLDGALTCHEEWDLFLRLSAKGAKFLYINETLSSVAMSEKNLSSNNALMDSTREVVGKRAKALWKQFKRNINLKRYLMFKVYARLINFPLDKKFNQKSPREILFDGDRSLKKGV